MPRIIDIRSVVQSKSSLRQAILDGLLAPSGERAIPTLVLYDERGLRLYDDITTEAKEYYLFGCEEEILSEKGAEIVRLLRKVEPSSGSMEATSNVGQDANVLELGAGALRKTSHLLQAFASSVSADSTPGSTITYYALDLERRELERTLNTIIEPTGELAQALSGRVGVRGLCGTYDDGIKFVNAGGLSESCGGLSIPSTSDPDEIRERGRRLAKGHVASNSSLSASPYSKSPPDTLFSSMASRGSGFTTPLSSHGSPKFGPTSISHPPLHVLFLGSSIGNFPRSDAAAFLRSLPLRPGSGDTLLLGLDGRNSKDIIEPAYHDKGGWTNKFITNGLRSAGNMLGQNLFDQSKWEYSSRYDETKGRHEAYYKCIVPHTIQIPSTETDPESKLTGVSFLQDELVHIEYAYKYSDADAFELFNASGLRPVHRWRDSRSLYSLWLLERPPFSFPLIQQPSFSDGTVVDHPFAVPTVSDWKTMWAAWDHITLGMIPTEMLHTKPIDLRHICLFYLGHIPTFLDIHLTRLLGGAHTEPSYFKDIFERGIDPHVDDPSQCHPHSEVPTSEDDWPVLDQILAFRDSVRHRLLTLYERIARGERLMDRRTARVLFMTFEHEGFHAETLLYMLLQKVGSGTIPPPGFSTPPWDLLQNAWAFEQEHSLALSSPTVTLGPTMLSLGHDDDEVDDQDLNLGGDLTGVDVTSVDEATRGHEYGWDNEHPKRMVQVAPFKMSWRAITNGEFYEFWKEKDESRKVQMPASWIDLNGDIMVRTLHGPVPIKAAWHWPVLTSYDDLSRYAQVKGGRIPTEPELRLFLDLYHDSSSINIGFRNWHPVPGTTGGGVGGGRGHNGGVWEFTSTIMESHAGYKASALYPGYSSDFFDQAHHIVIGGSYATIPRIAQRRSLRNFYQHNYPYAWVGARVAFDV